MKITHQVLNFHQLSLEDFQALEKAYDIVNQIQDSYDEKCVLMSPNDGECVEVAELARVKGILSFLMVNRVVEINAKQ